MQIYWKKRGKIWAYRGKRTDSGFCPCYLLLCCYSRVVLIYWDSNKKYGIVCLTVYCLIIMINSYWMRLSKILWFVSGEQINIWPWKIIDLQYTDKSRYFATTELVNYFIIQSLSWFVNDYLPFCHFHERASTRRKAWLYLCMSRILFAAKHSCMKRHMNKSLFVGSYLQVTWWPLGQWKWRKLCIKW